MKYYNVEQAVKHVAYDKAVEAGRDAQAAYDNATIEGLDEARVAEIEERLEALDSEAQSIFIERAMEGCEAEWSAQLVADYRWLWENIK